MSLRSVGVATRRLRAPTTLARHLAIRVTDTALYQPRAADVTYLATWTSWLYLDVVLDVARRVDI